MADTTVELYNNTIQWSSYTSNSQTLLTTDANTRYVIKDVELDGNTYTSTNGLALTINNTKVASLTANLTGSEIMDVSSTLAISINDYTGTYFTLNGLLNGSSVYKGLSTNSDSDGYFSGTLATSTTTTNTATNLVTSLTGTSSVRNCWFIGSDFYYYHFDGNSTTGLYRRIGGIDGTQQNITNGSYTPVCFDGVNKFYWFTQGGALFAYNTSTNTTISMGFSSAAGSTYPLIAYCNGFLFWCPTYSSNTMYWYHIATGNNGSVSCANYSSQTGWVALYDSSLSSYQIRIVHLNATGSYASSGYFTELTINPAGTGILNSNYGVLNVPNSIAFSGSMSSTGNKYAIMCGSNSSYTTLYIVDRGMNIISSKKINLPSGEGFNSYYTTPTILTSPTATQKNALGPSTKLRITGVKQT